MPRWTCGACGWIWVDRPTPVVLVLAMAPDGRVLYARRDSWPPGAWALIAGYVERGETAEQAALREVREEAGLEALSPAYLTSLTFRDQLLLCFRVEIAGGEPRAGSDVDEVELAPPDPSRIPAGAPARWLVERFAARQDGREDRDRKQAETGR